MGVIGPRLLPVFRDREELASSADLGRELRRALNDASALVVVCSPNSARSQWVNEEIRAFAALGRRERILCLIIGGTAQAVKKGQSPDLECLPPALFDGTDDQPLAADIRPGADDRATAKLKLLASILGVGFDELRQRENARRQRQLAAVAGGSAVGFLLMSGLAATAVLSRNEALHQRDIARQKTLTAERTTGFVKSLFQVVDPSESRGDTLTARQILDRGAREIDQGLSGEPNVKADLSTTLGEVYATLGMIKSSEKILRSSLALPGLGPEARARQYAALGRTAWQGGEYERALQLNMQALAFAKQAGDLGEPLVPRILSGISYVQMRTGDHASAQANARRALAMDRRRGAEEIQIASDLEVVGQTLIYGGELAAARAPLEQALAIRLRRQGAKHPLVADDLNTLGSIAYLADDTRAAERYFREALAGYESVLGDDHPLVASGLNNVARVLLERRAFSEADVLLRRALAINLSRVGEEADDLIFEYSNLGIAQRGLGRLEAADANFGKAESLARQRGHRNLAPILVERAEIACLRGRAQHGLKLTEEARPIMASKYPRDPWRVAWVDAVRGDCLGRQKVGRGASLLEASAPTIRKRWAPTSLYGARLAAMQARARQ